MLFLLAVLTGSSASWAQQDLVIPTNTEEHGTWNGSDAYTYDVPFDKIGNVKAVFSGITSGSDRDGESKCVKFKMNTTINITAPSGYVVTYAKVDFNASSQFHFNFAQSGGSFLKNGTAESVDWTYAEPQNTIRIANRANVNPASSDVLVKSITIRLHKAPTVSIASDKVIWTTLNEPVTLTSTITGGEADRTFGEWFLYTSDSDTNNDNNKFLGYSNTGFTFTPSQGVKKNGTEEVLKSGYTNASGPYYIGVHARQECIGGNGWENSANEIYTVNVGVRISVNTYPAGLENTINIHQKDHPDWVITNGQVVGQYTTAVFNANVPTGYTFLGWYLGDEKLSDQTSYLFTKHTADGNVNSDITLTAKYDGGRLPSNLDMVYQPIFGENHSGQAKEYITFANLPANYYRLTEAISSSCGTATSLSGIGVLTSADHKNTNYRNNLCYILGTEGYTVDSEKGLCISQRGKAGVQAGQVYAPTKAALAMKVAGTVDFYLLAKNYLETQSGGTYGHDRRHIKIWYKNDQSAELKPLNCTNEGTNDYYFYGERFEDNQNNGLSPLSFGVRLQHLGKDGTCDIYVTYESDEADGMVWIKGILVKRPDLKVTIGRTDKLRYNGDNPIHSNSKLTPFGENQPYQWNFGTAGFKNTHPDDIETKKVNRYDGRTYICGAAPNGEQIMDHVLVYSDAKGAEKAGFDGRPSNGKHAGFEDDETDHNEHIEFNHPTIFTGNNAMGTPQNGFDKDRRSFTPILSNGLKVNVTGSGWFTIACSAPNGAVNMKVLSSTNGGTAYINLLREFKVEKSNDPKPETDWQTYRVYLKAHAEKDGDDGFWDGAYLEHDAVYGTDVPKLDPEDTQMSLYVVFDKIDGVTYKDGETAADAQLNIHYLQWINEMPADYVFQREEDPKLLNTLQSIVSNGTEVAPGLYWQAGNKDMWEENYASIPTKNTSIKTYPSSFDSGAQIQNAVIPGEDSGYGSASRLLGGEWSVAANANSVAHTEVAYANAAKNYTDNSVNVYSYETATSTAAADSHKNLEFAIPISGSFFRFMPMKNQFISTWVVPEAGKSTSIYILDETGKPIPFCDGADTNGETNKSKITQEARERGWIHAATYPGGKTTANPIVADGTKALRIDFAALAGKEYFIVTNGGKISLARLQATGNAWRADVEAIDGALTLTDNANNSSALNTAMASKSLDNGKYARYAPSVTVNRKLVAGKWVALVLPFSMNEKKFEEVFGTGARCIHFTDYKDKTVHLTHHFYNMIVAGRPVFVKPTVDVNALTITDVTLQASAPVNTTTPSGMVFEGSYNNTTMSQYDFYLNNNNEIRYLNTASAAYPGLRSIIRTNGKYSPAATNDAPVAMFLNYDDSDMDGATGIESVIAEEFGQNAILVTKSTKVYDLNGRVVANGADMMNNLPSGVYIVNGKKYVK